MTALQTDNTAITLTSEQQAAADMAIEFLNQGKSNLFRIGGYAGTGKTTIAKHIVASFSGSPIVCAFTGKAASVLRSKGLRSASTIHRAIYQYDEATSTFLKIAKHQLRGDYFLIDEGSMVSSDLWQDVTDYDMPVIVIGDPGQLEPVGKNPDLMRDTDVVLETIHRQAAESDIIQMANAVRHGWPIEPVECRDVAFVGRGEFNSHLQWADQILCGFNATRVRTNKIVRAARGYDGVLNQGERIVVLHNDRELKVFNGQMFTVAKIRQSNPFKITADLVGDDGEKRHRIPIWTGHFNRPKSIEFDEKRRIRGVVFADYGYAVTVHKFQGSEADRVLVKDEQCSVWNPVRWRYTAITRAAKELRYCL